MSTFPEYVNDQPQVRRFTRKEYDSLVESGFFEEDEKVELLEGLILPMSPQDPRHSRTIGRLSMQLSAQLIGRAEVLGHSPFAASDDSEPEPDLCVFPTTEDGNEHPTRAHCIIEVAFTSQHRDRRKVAIYARANVPQLILIDVPKRKALVYRTPRDGDYERIETHHEGTRIVIDAFPDVTIELANILPRLSST